MQDVPMEIRRQLAARSNWAMIGFLGLGAVLLFPTMGMGAFLMLWALIQRGMAEWLIRRGRLVPATLHGRPAHAGENWKQETAVLSTMFRRRMAHAFTGFILFMARMVPMVLVACEFEIDGRRKRISKYMFSNERIDLDEKGMATMLVNPRFPRMHGWLVSHIPAHDRGIIPSTLQGDASSESADGTTGTRSDEDSQYRDAA